MELWDIYNDKEYNEDYITYNLGCNKFQLKFSALECLEYIFPSETLPKVEGFNIQICLKNMHFYLGYLFVGHLEKWTLHLKAVVDELSQ